MKRISLKTLQGELTGRVEDGVCKFLGVPYAEAPVGELQFRAPVDKQGWTGVLDATRLPPDAIQHPYSKKTCSEDCLRLNLYVPSHDEGELLPVVVWLFGGSYVHGGCSASFKHGSKGLYDGSLFAKENRCIVVTVNYRVGLYGFLYLLAFDERFESNLGLRDAESALRWVRRNIESYGGDASNVTLWGQSAGAALTLAMLCVPSARGLFHKAISQSACLESFYSKEEAADVATRYLTEIGLSAESLNEVRTMDYRSTTQVIGRMDDYVRARKFGICTINPVVDGEYLMDFPSLSKFEHSAVPLIIGSTRDEAQIFGFVVKNFQEDEIFRRMFPNFPLDYPKRVISRYASSPTVRDYCDMASDMMYKIPKLRVAEDMARHASVYVYRFDYRPWLLTKIGVGACHASDVPLVFGNMTPWFHMPLYIGDARVAAMVGARMRRHWGCFIRDSRPGDEWKAYTPECRHTMVFDKVDRLELDLEADVLERFEGHRHFFILE